MSNETIDQATFAELQEAAGAEFVTELVQTFLEEAPEMLKELRESQAAGDADTFRRAAHSLKSNSLTFGAVKLGALSRDLELGGLAAAQEPEALDALMLEFLRVDAALKALCHV